MKYADIKNILYKSIEIQQIPDKWMSLFRSFARLIKKISLLFVLDCFQLTLDKTIDWG